MPGPGLSVEQRLQLAGDAVARADMVADVGPVEARDDQPVRGNSELDEDVGAGARVRCRGQRESGHVRERVEQRKEQPVVRPEVVPPFADAMRLVDRDQRQRHLLDQRAKAFAGRPLGRDVEQLQLAALQPLDGRGAVGIGRGQRGGTQPERFGCADLVVHQRDQRGDDQHRPGQGQRRHLIAERLARAGRHHRQRAPPVHHPADHLLLNAAEAGEAERVAKDGKR